MQYHVKSVILFLNRPPFVGLPTTVQWASLHIDRMAVELDIGPGRSPLSVAATSIYMASKASEVPLSIRQIRESAGVADTTIRQSYQLMFTRPVPTTRKGAIINI